MRVPNSPIVIVATIALFGLVAYWGLFGFFVWQAPVPYSELDFNHNGNVELFEAMYAAEYGTRNTIVGGKQCTEYYALKDAHVLRIDCAT
jgi:hypothetical protein